MYTNMIDPINGKTMGIFRLADKACIPMNEANLDYRQYLVWVAEGNIAEEWNPNGNQ